MRLKLFALSKTLPALPAFGIVPVVATEIFPPSEIVKLGKGAKDGADTEILPASPVPDAVLNNPVP